MVITNKKKSHFLRRVFFLGSFVIVVGALVMYLLDIALFLIIPAGVFALWFLLFQVADFQYIEFNNDDNKVSLRYYKAIKFGKTNYNSIEFPQSLLYKFHFENSIFGEMTDLTLIVRTRRGIAEYPSVSLTALPREDRKKLQEVLLQILDV